MKKNNLKLCLYAILLLSTKAMGQTVTVSDVEALPGETITFSLSYEGGKADTYTSLQFDLGLESGFSPTGTPTFSSAWPGATGAVGNTCACASASEMQGTSIDNLVTVSIKVDEDVSLGSHDVTLSNIQFRYGTTGQHDDAPNVTFKINVVSVHTVVLDETSTTPPSGATGVNVRVLRTIKANEWSTICLPFAMTEVQVKSAFGNDVQLGDFSSWSSEEDNEGDIVGITVCFTAITEIKANHPCLIKVSSAVTDFTVDGVDIDLEEEPSVQVGKKKAERGYLIGSYVANTAIPEKNLFLNANKFWYSVGKTKMKAFRAYFELADVLAEVENAAARISMNFDEKETTGISVLKSNDNSKTFYDIQGRRVANPTKGLYIQNGMKRVIK